MSALRLSYSQMNKFLFCPTAWKHHYINRYRPLEVSSALLFGSAIGKALEYALKPNNSFSEYKDEYEAFYSEWTFQKINGVLTEISKYPHVAYSKYDIDIELLTKEEIEETGGDYGLLAWFGLRAKGTLILDSFNKNLRPLITKIYSVEEKIELLGKNGDSSIGYADAVIDLKGYNKPVVLDFKTAAREYELDSVIKSVQLSQYISILGEKYGTRLCGYAVFLKNITKNRVKICDRCEFDGSNTRHKTCNNNNVDDERCNGSWIETLKPEAKMQLIVDEIPQETEDFVVDNIAIVSEAIKAGIYTKNINGCHDNGFGRKCEFYDVCWKKDLSKYVVIDE